MSVHYIHKEQITNSLDKAIYKRFYEKKYKPMRRKVNKLDFVNDSDSFAKFASILETYWSDLMDFEKEANLSSNCKLHTTFLEEISCYFLHSIPIAKDFDVFTDDVFAGLKMNSNGSIGFITKNVDFCIGKEVSMYIKRKKYVLRVPVVSVEVKTYTDKTMLGEITNTARKLKGANPKSKAILLMWVSGIKEESVIEAACDNALDEIIVISTEKRKKGKPTPVVFTEKGLKDYWEVLSIKLEESLVESNIPEMGKILSYARLMQKGDI